MEDQKLDIRHVQDGDIVQVRDRTGHSIMGVVTHRDGRWTVQAFSTDITVAKDRNNKLGKHMVGGLTLIGHMGKLV